MTLGVLRKVFSGLRTVGPHYALRIVPNEMARPRLALTRHIRALLIRIGDLVRGAPAASAAWSDRGLQFFCDLAATPITFDFATYLAAAEIERRVRGLSAIDVVFVLGPYHGVRKETPAYEAAIDHDARLWRLRHVLIPMLAFLPSVRGYAVCTTREQAQALITDDPACLYPADYRVFLPRQPGPSDLREHARRNAPIWPLFRATERGRKLAGEYLTQHADGRRAIVITLRQSDLSPERNSRTADWLAFADSLDPRRYAAIFVHDSETAMRVAPAGSRHSVCDAAAWNLELRMALYELAWLNMAIMHGPLELCWYNRQARYLAFIPVGVDVVTQREALEEAGHRVGHDIEFAEPYQHIVWQADELAAIRAAFDAMEPRLAAMDPARQAQAGARLTSTA